MKTLPLDLAPITRHLRSKAGSNLLVAAVHHLNVPDQLINGPMSIFELQQNLGLKERPAMVLFPALCAMQILRINAERKVQLTEMGRYLTSEYPVNLIGYSGLESQDPGVLKLTQWLRNDGPEHIGEELSYVKDDASASPMDDPESARFFTLALAGRARYLAPIVAENITRCKGHLLDIACGTGYYAYEWLLANSHSTATLFDRPEVLKTADKLLDDFCNSDREGVSNLKDRVHFEPGDMFTGELPEADIVLAASLFHDWPTSTCQVLAKRFAAALKPGGSLWIHDAFLNDSLDGPLAVTDYSTMLFLGTKGRAYSRQEYRQWFSDAGLVPGPDEIPTLMDYGLISAHKPG